MDIEGSNKIS